MCSSKYPAMSPFFRFTWSSFATIAADEGDPLLDRLAAARDVLQLARQELATHGATSVQAALFVLPDHDLERMTRDDAVLGERLCDFDRRERADVAVVVAALRDRVDVRAEKNRLERRITSRRAADDVAGEVDRSARASPPASSP